MGAALQSAAVAQDAMQQQLQQLRVDHAAEVERQKGESDLQMQERKAEQRHNAALEKAFLKLEKESHEMIRCEKQKVRNLQQQLAKLESCSQIDYQKALESVSSKPDAESEQLKARMAALEADLTKALSEEWSDEEDLETPRILTGRTSACCWEAPTMDSTACS